MASKKMPERKVKNCGEEGNSSANSSQSMKAVHVAELTTMFKMPKLHLSKNKEAKSAANVAKGVDLQETEYY